MTIKAEQGGIPMFEKKISTPTSLIVEPSSQNHFFDKSMKTGLQIASGLVAFLPAAKALAQKPVATDSNTALAEKTDKDVLDRIPCQTTICKRESYTCSYTHGGCWAYDSFYTNHFCGCCWC
jgi:hypothetical protein